MGGPMLPPMQFLPHSPFFGEEMLRKLRDPIENARMAHEVMKRYGSVRDQWRAYAKKEKTMPGIELRAPFGTNPYRVREHEEFVGEAPTWGLGSPGRVPRRSDGDTGPGLTGADIDRMVRQHFLDGFAKAESEGEARVEEMRGQLANAFDEGYVEGRKFRATSLARDYWPRLMGPRVAVTALEEVLKKPRATKKEIAEAVALLRREQDELNEWAQAMLNDPSGSVADDPHVERA